MASIFTKIIRGELPSYKIHEDELTLSFLTREAIRPGHTLVIPKIEIDSFTDVPEPYYSAVFRNAQKIGKAIHQATGCRRVGTIIAGWDVPHFHYHVVPMMDVTDLDFRKAKLLSSEENLELQRKITEKLSAILSSSTG